MTRTSKNDEMDLLLYSAMPYVELKELEEYEKAAEIPVILSKNDKKRILKRIKRAGEYRERHEAYRPAKETFKRVAVVALVVMSLCFTGAISIESVRVALWETIVEWYENSIFFAYVNGDDSGVPDEILEYKEPRLDESYSRYEGRKSEYSFVVEYEKNDTLIMYEQSLLKEYEILLSNNETIMEPIEINGYAGNAIVLKSYGECSTTIIWNDYVYTYKLVSNLSLNELLQIAENIE